MSVERFSISATDLPIQILPIENSHAAGKYIFVKDKTLPADMTQNEEEYPYTYQAMMQSNGVTMIITALVWENSTEFQSSLQRLFSSIKFN